MDSKYWNVHLRCTWQVTMNNETTMKGKNKPFLQSFPFLSPVCTFINSIVTVARSLFLQVTQQINICFIVVIPIYYTWSETFFFLQISCPVSTYCGSSRSWVLSESLLPRSCPACCQAPWSDWGWVWCWLRKGRKECYFDSSSNSRQVLGVAAESDTY